MTEPLNRLPVIQRLPSFKTSGVWLWIFASLCFLGLLYYFSLQQFSLYGPQSLDLDWSFGVRHRDIDITSFDPDTRLVQGNVKDHSNQKCVDLMKRVHGLSDDKTICMVGSLKVVDIKNDVLLFGARPSPFSSLLDSPLYYASQLTTDHPIPWDAETTTLFSIQALGNPARYPFDRYLVAGEMHQLGAFVSKDSHESPSFTENPIPDLFDGPYNIAIQLPGYEVAELSPQELSRWMAPAPPRSSFSPDSLADFASPKIADPDRYWQNHVFCFEIKRPLFVRALTILIWGVALISIIAVTTTADPQELTKTLGVSLLSLWGLHNILSASAPKIPNLWDYSIAFLILLQIVIVLLRRGMALRTKS